MQEPSNKALRLLPPIALALILPACIGSRVIYPVLPNAEELARFEAAGPNPPALDVAELSPVQVGQSVYTTVVGDLLEFQMPAAAVSGAQAQEAEELVTVKARVRDDGSVTLPLIGQVQVAGKGLTTIEEELIAAYSEALISNEPPNVVATVLEYKTVSVAVLGAVASPGIHKLRSDRQSIVGALMEAGGISGDQGASMIRVLNAQGEDGAKTLEFPVRGANIPTFDYALQGGETVVVDAREEKQFTVIGLVRRPGAQAYPPSRTYNLMQAIAVAGGTNDQAAPRYASIYRRDAAGDVVGATFRIDGTSLTDASNILIKPGDVVAVEHTQGSWTRMFLSQVLGFRASANATTTN